MISSPIFALVMPTSIGFSPPKLRFKLVVPLRYLITHFTAFQCFLLGLERKRLNTIIARAVSGLEHTMAYINLMDETYGTLSISCFFLLVIGHCLVLNLKWGARGLAIGLALIQAKPLKHLLYVLLLWQGFLEYVYWVIIKLKICFAWPKSFIPKNLL